MVKGVRFRDHRIVGDILDLAGRYRDAGADELVFYDISASPEGRSVDRTWVSRVARILDIPFCVAGGIRSVDDAEAVLASGAEKISVNSPALSHPELIDELSERFGAQCVVVGIDSQTVPAGFRVQQFTGDAHRTRDTARDTLAWVAEVQRRGAGEIVLNCMASDGVRQGYDIAQLCAVRGIMSRAIGGLRRRGHPGAFRRRVPDGGRRCGTRRQRVPFGRDRHTGVETRTAHRRHRGETMMDATRLDWDKDGGLLPAIVQDAANGAVLMLGYMNRDALAETLSSQRVTFWSRSKNRLWTKGETSGHFLELRGIAADCDGDTLLVLAEPRGPACHTGTPTCWGEQSPRAAGQDLAFLGTLQEVIRQRIAERPEGSYTAKLLGEGTRRIAQKVGEEGLELALAAVAQSDSEIIGEAADLLYHAMLLLQVKHLSLAQVVEELRSRHDGRRARSPADSSEQ